MAVLKRALDNIRPSLEVRSRRVGGATIRSGRGEAGRANTLSLRWLTDFSALVEKTMAERLAETDACNGLGASVKRRRIP